MKVIDASLALKWFVKESFGQESADLILNELRDNPRGFAVPDLFFAEMFHVLSKIFRNSEKTKEAVAILESLGFERVGLGHELLQEAAEITYKYSLSGYDAIYVATARMLEGHWYTFDPNAHKKLTGLNVSQLLT